MVVISPDERQAYVANLRTDTLTVIDLNTRQIEKQIVVGDGAEGLAISPDGIVRHREINRLLVNTSTQPSNRSNDSFHPRPLLVTAAVPVARLSHGPGVTTQDPNGARDRRRSFGRADHLTDKWPEWHPMTTSDRGQSQHLAIRSHLVSKKAPMAWPTSPAP